MNRQSLDKRASSIYSQPSPPEDEGLHRTNTVRSEVSSLTIRSSVDNDSRSSPLVSPISTHFPESDVQTRQERTKQEHPFRSQLPRPVPSETTADRPTPSYRKPPTVAPAVATEKQETRWDSFSGEPTDSEKGKPASARPGVAPAEVQYPHMPMTERAKQLLGDFKERGQAKKPGWAKAPPPVDDLEHPAYREPWKGASGRVALVDPVKNTPAARLERLNIPQRNISRTHALSNEAARSYNSEPPPTHAFSPEQKVPTVRAVGSQDSIKPVVPLKLGSNSSSRVVSPTTPMTTMSQQNNSLQSPFKSPQHTFLHTVPESITKPMEHDLVESPTDNEPLTPTTPTQANASTHQTRMDNLLPAEPEENVSRFSWTTYTATEPGSPTPPTYDDTPVPPLPSVQSPLVIRKRPIPSHTGPSPYTNSNAAISNASFVSRKPVPLADRYGTPSTEKELPQCPPEAEASDKITTLEARLVDLARQKSNIEKIKANLNKELRRNAILYSASKRKEVEAELKARDREMDEITQEEREIAMSLRRAQKKIDREENREENTGLWIKRVTS
jgi:hypothetical protein